MDTKLKNPGLLLRSLLASAVTVLALAQGASPNSELPKLHGQTLDGKSIVLPNDAAGKVTLLVLGASRKGGEQTNPWKEHFIADFGANPQAAYYVAALLQRVPTPFRAVIRTSMRSGTPNAVRSHVLTSASDEDAWKNYLGMGNDSLPGVLLFDESGHALWSHVGVFDVHEYEALKTAAGAALGHL
jgi:hypothetical protein